MGYKTVEVREIAIQHRVNGAAIAAAVVVLREILGLAACLWEQQLKFNPYLCFHCWLKKPFLDFHWPKGDTRKNILEMDRYIILLISWVFELVKISNAIKIQIHNWPSRNAICGHRTGKTLVICFKITISCSYKYLFLLLNKLGLT